jgi:hypothetical protein
MGIEEGDRDMKIAAIAIVLMLGFGCSDGYVPKYNDKVEITDGFYKGLTGVVKEECPGLYSKVNVKSEDSEYYIGIYCIKNRYLKLAPRECTVRRGEHGHILECE